MTGVIVTGARVVADRLHAPGWLVVSPGLITGYGDGAPPDPVGEGFEHVDAGGGWLLPGFIDVHAHGANGHETMDADPGGLEAMAAFYSRHGVTAFLPTTWTASAADTLAALEAVAAVVGEPLPGATVLGAHMEGPYLSGLHCGAQDWRHIRPVDRAEATRFLDTGVVRLMTIAPEVGDNLWLVRECAARGITPSVGHTAACYDDVVRAVEAGARHATHTFNAMRPLHHREPGTVGAALSLPEIACELIADRVHVHEAAMRILHATKTSDGMLLVTDAVRATGLPSGTYELGSRTVVAGDGAVRMDGDGSLAGSLLTMDVAFRNLASATGLGPAELWPAASRTAARAAGVAELTGEIAVGKRADLVLLDLDLSVRLTLVAGRAVYRRDDAPTPTADVLEEQA